MTVEQVANGVRALAQLHGAYWGNRLQQYPQLWWVEPFVAWRGMAVGIDIGLERAGDGALELPAGEKLSRDDLWLRYRASSAHGLTMWLVTAASDWQRLEVSLALAHRYASAFIDLDGAAAINELASSGAP